MPSNSVPIVNSARPHERPDRLVLIGSGLAAWLGRRSTHAALDRLSDHALLDLGLERTERGFRVTPGSIADRQRRRW
jgi:uncharacterized protein YjiS (DUF1127 family)